MCSGTLPEITVCGHISLCSPQMQVKAVSCKEAICEHHPETQLSSQGQSSFRMVWGKIKICSVVSWIKIWNSFWKPWTPCLADWRREGPSSLSAGSSKSCFSAGMGLHYSLGNVQLTYLEKHHLCWRVHIYVLEPHMFPSRQCLSGKTLHISTRQY